MIRRELRHLRCTDGHDHRAAWKRDTLAEDGHADGTIGRTRSQTLNAVQAFQGRNGLKADENLGGPNSMTRKKLTSTTAQLVPAATMAGVR